MSVDPISSSQAASGLHSTPKAEKDKAQADAASSSPPNTKNPTASISSPAVEAAESPVQTAKEALTGDRQAQRLQQRREAAKANDAPRPADNNTPSASANSAPSGNAPQSHVDTKV